MKNNEEKTDETGDFIRVTSMKSEIDIAHLQSFHSRKQSKTRDCLSFTITESTIFFFDRFIFFSIALFHDRAEQTIREDDREAAVTVHLSHVIIIISSLFKQSQNQESSALNEEK